MTDHEIPLNNNTVSREVGLELSKSLVICYEYSRGPKLTVVSFLWDFFSAGFPSVSWESASNRVWQRSRESGAAVDTCPAGPARFPS